MGENAEIKFLEVINTASVLKTFPALNLFRAPNIILICASVSRMEILREVQQQFGNKIGVPRRLLVVRDEQLGQLEKDVSLQFLIKESSVIPPPIFLKKLNS